MQRSIHKFKVRICTFKAYLKFYGFFILNSKRVLNSVDFSPFTKAQNDNALPFLQVDFFARVCALQAVGLLSIESSK